MHIPFESIPLKYIKEKLDWYQQHEPQKLKKISLRAENLTEYGIELYHQQKLSALIHLLDTYPEIEEIELPIGLNIGEINKEILNSLCQCQKINFIALHIEAGSNHLLKLINKSHTTEQALHILTTLRAY